MTQLLIYALVAVVIFASGVVTGIRMESQKLADYIAKQATEAVHIVTKQGEATTRVITKYVKVKADAEAKTQTIEKEVIKYVEANPGNCLDARWGVLHDAAATNILPDAASAADGTRAAPTAAAALETVTANYSSCNGVADRLDALQDWVREQQKANPAKP